MLDWLEGYAGESYQDRWIASDSDNQPKAWCPQSTGIATRSEHGCPSTHSFCSASFARYDWLIENKQARFYRDWTTTHEPEAWDRYFAAAQQEGAPEVKKWRTVTHLVRISIVNGLPITELHSRRVGLSRLSDLDRQDAGRPSRHVALRPPRRTLRRRSRRSTRYLIAKRLTPTELVDRFDVRAPAFAGF